MRNFKVEDAFKDKAEDPKQLKLLFKGPKLDVEIDFRHEEKLYITDIYSRTDSKAKKLAQMLDFRNLRFEHELDGKISNQSKKDISEKLLFALYDIDPEGNSHMISPTISGEKTFIRRLFLPDRKR